jgi:hypothetical protein
MHLLVRIFTNFDCDFVATGEAFSHSSLGTVGGCGADGARDSLDSEPAGGCSVLPCDTEGSERAEDALLAGLDGSDSDGLLDSVDAAGGAVLPDACGGS